MMDRMCQLEEENAKTKVVNQEHTQRVNWMITISSTFGGNPFLLSEIHEIKRANTHILSPFADKIALVKMPKMSIHLTFHKFLKDIDSAEHVSEYHQEMSLVILPSDYSQGHHVQDIR